MSCFRPSGSGRSSHGPGIRPAACLLLERPDRQRKEALFILPRAALGPDDSCFQQLSSPLPVSRILCSLPAERMGMPEPAFSV